MKKKILRVLSLILCITFIFSLSLSASALSVSKTTKATKMSVVTYGDKVLGKTTPITIKNTSDYPIKVTFTKISDCKVYRSNGAGFSSWSSITIYAGNSAKVNIKTSWLKSGVVDFKVESSMSMPYSYSVTGSNYSMIARIG